MRTMLFFEKDNNQAHKRNHTNAAILLILFTMIRASINTCPSPLPLHGSPLLGPPLSTTHLQQAMLRGLDEYCGSDSIVAYDSARQEYREFCESLYPNDEFKFLVNDQKKIS